MNDEILRLTEADIRTRCTKISFERGRNYYAGGFIKKYIRHETSLEAYVEGTQTYRVTVRVRVNGELETYCNCPYAYGGGLQTHCGYLAGLGG